jgi:hypothetical protein
VLPHRDSPAHQDPDRLAGVVLPGALGLAVGFVASIAATLISWALGAGSDPRVGLALLTVTAIAVGAVTTVPGAVAAGALCWAFYAGFILDRAGTLTLDRGGGQMLLTVVLSAVAASAVAGLVRWARAVAADSAPARSVLPVSANDPGIASTSTTRFRERRKSAGSSVETAAFSYGSGNGAVVRSHHPV